MEVDEFNTICLPTLWLNFVSAPKIVVLFYWHNLEGWDFDRYSWFKWLIHRWPIINVSISKWFDDEVLNGGKCYKFVNQGVVSFLLLGFCRAYKLQGV